MALNRPLFGQPSRLACATSPQSRCPGGCRFGTGSRRHRTADPSPSGRGGAGNDPPTLHRPASQGRGSRAPPRRARCASCSLPRRSAWRSCPRVARFDGQPVPLSSLWAASNSGWKQAAHTEVPDRFSPFGGLVPEHSVPCSNSTAWAAGDTRAFHSAAVLLSGNRGLAMAAPGSATPASHPLRLFNMMRLSVTRSLIGPAACLLSAGKQLIGQVGVAQSANTLHRTDVTRPRCAFFSRVGALTAPGHRATRGAISSADEWSAEMVIIELCCTAT